MFDITNWEYLFTFGDKLLIFAQGNHRVGIDRDTCDVVIEYDFIKGG